MKLQAELDLEHPELDIALLAVNQTGYESGIDEMSALGPLPILQDTADADVWTSWAVTWRDLVVLDAAGNEALVFNLTTYNLADPDNYATLERHLVEIASGG